MPGTRGLVSINAVLAGCALDECEIANELTQVVQ